MPDLNEHNRLIQGLLDRLGRSADKPRHYRRDVISALTEVLSNNR